MKKIFLLVFIFGFSLCEGQTWLWGTAAVSLNINATSDPLSVCTDTSGNIYEVGGFYNSVIFGITTLSNNIVSTTSYLVKYNKSGSVVWAKGSVLSNNTSETIPFSVATDISGNSFVTGWFCDSVTLGSILLTNNVAWEITSFIAKYDTGGNVLWAESAKNLKPTYSSQGYSVAINSKGNSYNTGEFTGDSLTFGALKIYGNFFFVKYNTLGNVIWAKGAKVNGLGSIERNSMKIDNSGNIYITGNFSDSAIFGSDTLKNHSYSDVFVVKYDSTGNVIWAKCANPMGKNGSAAGAAITIDNSNNIYVAGQFEDTVLFGPFTFNYQSSGNIFIEKYEPNGNLINVTSSTPSVSSGDVCYSIVSNKWNEIYLCGNFSDTIKFGAVKLSAPAPSSAFIFKFDTALNAFCGTVINDDNDDAQDGSYIASDPLADDIYLSGDGFGANDSISLGTITLTGTGQEFAFLAKWQPCNITTEETPINNRKEKLTVYPNPSTGIFTIASASPQNFVPATIEIYNVLGEKVYSQIVHSSSFIVNLNQPNGIYLYRIIAQDGSLVGEGKVVIQK